MVIKVVMSLIRLLSFTYFAISLVEKADYFESEEHKTIYQVVLKELAILHTHFRHF